MYRRKDVLNLYKQLVYLGRDYPSGYEYFHGKLRKAFEKNRLLNTEKEVDQAIARGEFVIKEIEALYFLKKYRSIKEKYYPD